MMKKRLLSAVISTAILIFLLSGCGKESIVSEENMQPVSSDEKMGDPSDYNIVMIVKQNDSWFEDMAMGICPFGLRYRQPLLSICYIILAPQLFHCDGNTRL